MEFLDTPGSPDPVLQRKLRKLVGGNWSGPLGWMAKSFWQNVVSDQDFDNLGFRVVRVTVPEPMSLVVLALGIMLVLTRRNRLAR